MPPQDEGRPLDWHQARWRDLVMERDLRKADIDRDRETIRRLEHWLAAIRRERHREE